MAHYLIHYLAHPRDALCDWGIWGCDEHIRTGWFQPRWGPARRQCPSDSDLMATLNSAEREEYFGLGMGGGISVAGNARIEELEQIMRYRYFTDPYHQLSPVDPHTEHVHCLPPMGDMMDEIDEIRTRRRSDPEDPDHPSYLNWGPGGSYGK